MEGVVMDDALLIIVVVALLFTSGLVLGSKCGYEAGYAQAKHDLYAQWYEGPEGYCLADKPPHPGECH